MNLPPHIEELASRDWQSRKAPCSVSAWAIRAWCAAVGISDDRFVNDDDEAATIAPPPMLQCWAGGGLLADQSSRPTVHAQLRSAFTRAGFTAVVATNYDQVYHYDLRPGDFVHETYRIETVSELKHTALGPGHFVTVTFRYANQHGAEVGTLRVRTLYFEPRRAKAPPEMAQPGARVTQRAGAVQGVEIPITRRLIIAGSIASNDFEPVHHDSDIARQHGLEDIILSIITTAGLVARYALQVGGPATRLQRISLRLGAPAIPGDNLVLSGQWMAGAAEGRELAVKGTVSRGTHVEATAAL